MGNRAAEVNNSRQVAEVQLDAGELESHPRGEFLVSIAYSRPDGSPGYDSEAFRVRIDGSAADNVWEPDRAAVIRSDYEAKACSIVLLMDS